MFMWFQVPIIPRANRNAIFYPKGLYCKGIIAHYMMNCPLCNSPRNIFLLCFLNDSLKHILGSMLPVDPNANITYKASFFILMGNNIKSPHCGQLLLQVHFT